MNQRKSFKLYFHTSSQIFSFKLNKQDKYFVLFGYIYKMIARISGSSNKAGQKTHKGASIRKKTNPSARQTQCGRAIQGYVNSRTWRWCSGQTRAQAFSKVMLHIPGFESMPFIYFYVEQVECVRSSVHKSWQTCVTCFSVFSDHCL